MQLSATYQELNSYIQARTGQPVSGALSFFTSQLPELAAGIHPEDGHRIRICLAEIEKAKPLVENIALQEICPCEAGLHVEFGLKAP